MSPGVIGGQYGSSIESNGGKEGVRSHRDDRAR